jgi:hypothetical protein
MCLATAAAEQKNTLPEQVCSVIFMPLTKEAGIFCETIVKQIARCVLETTIRRGKKSSKSEQTKADDIPPSIIVTIRKTIEKTIINTCG